MDHPVSARTLAGSDCARHGRRAGFLDDLPFTRGRVLSHVPGSGSKSKATQDGARLLSEALRLSLRRGAGPFRSAAHIAIEPRAYQLVPLLMALRLPVVRLLIADDVGVGKIVEAALIVGSHLHLRVAVDYSSRYAIARGAIDAAGHLQTRFLRPDSLETLLARVMAGPNGEPSRQSCGCGRASDDQWAGISLNRSHQHPYSEVVKFPYVMHVPSSSRRRRELGSGREW
jgi:hypothetical protein